MVLLPPVVLALPVELSLLVIEVDVLTFTSGWHPTVKASIATAANPVTISLERFMFGTSLQIKVISIQPDAIICDQNFAVI